VLLRASAAYWDRAAEDYAAGRETFREDAGRCWYSYGDQSVGVADIGDLNGRTLLELGCGHGAALEALALAFPKGHFTGLDFSQSQLRLASERTRRLRNVTLFFHDIRIGVPSGVGPCDELLSIYGALDFVTNPAGLLEAFIDCLAEEGICTVVTSVPEVRDALLCCSRLRPLRISSLGSRWFLRSVLVG
jgi:SAM-dependent methyltransferase